MNYEELYGALQSEQKRLKDSLAQLQRSAKQIARAAETGDLKTLRKTLEAVDDPINILSDSADAIKKAANDFDAAEYLRNGDFVTQMLQECEAKGVDVKGESPIFEMFPYRVRIDAENEDIWLDRKKLTSFRPSAFVAMVRAGQDKLNRVRFNAQSFATELAAAYDLYLLLNNKNKGSVVVLSRLYKLMVPMSRSRKEYDQQSFAYDLARLYQEREEVLTKDERRHEFGPTKNNSQAIRILDMNGKEQYLGTIRFFEA